jgi:iron complex outermembrane recepter protein
MSRKTRRNASRNATKGASAAIGRSTLTAIGIPGLALGAFTFNATALAADTGPAAPPATNNDNDQLQEIVVTGIRASLQRAADIKQQAVGVVDAISAEDIGQFPDASIGEAIARIPGVTVDRGSVSAQTSGGATTSTGSVSGITVRGFGATFNESLVNSRPIASGLGQNFDFSALGSQWVGEVEVLKTPDFSLSSGDVGATVNIKFPNPLDRPGMQARAYVSTTDYQTDGGFRPAGGFLWSNTFADNTIGVLVDGDYSDHHITTHHLDIVGWKGNFLSCDQYAAASMPAGCAPGKTSPLPSWTMQDMAMYLERADERRKDGRLALQWHPTDAVLITLDDNFSSYEQKIDRFQFSTWFGGNPENMVTDGNGTVTSFVQDSQQPFDFNSFVADTYLVTNTPGINVKWDVNDHWTAELDGDQSESKLNPNHTYSDIDVDTGYGNSVAQGTNGYIGGLVITGNNSVPYWTATGPNSNAATNPRAPNFFGTNPFIIGSHVLPIQEQTAVAKIDQAKVDATWHTDATKVKFGFQFVNDSYTGSEYDTFDFSGSNGYWQLWSGYGPASNNPGGRPLPPSLFTAVNIPNFIPGFSGNGNLPPGLLEYNPYAVANYLANQPINAGFTPANGYGPYVPGALPTLGLNPGSVSDIDRKNYSPFVTGEHDFDLGGDMKLKAHAGVRYQKTDVTVSGLAAPLVALGTQASDHTAYSFTLGPSQVTTATNSYHYILPSLDLNLQVRPDIKVRFDASRTETAAPNNNLVPNTTYGGRVNALVGTGHNAKLLPYLSNNFDLGAEWYYQRNSYVSVDGFQKHVTQFPVQGTQNVTFPNIIDPSPFSNTFGKPVTFAVTTTVNGQAANVDGIEFTWQQMLPLGFGFQVNGTYVHTNKPFDPRNIEQGTTQFALPGIGNSANLISFYQNYGFQARLAVQWQGEQFLNFGQEQNLSQFGTEPTFLEASTEVDFSSSYDINDHLSAFFEALNLTDAEYHTRGRFQNQLLNVVDYGRSFTIGVRAKL